MSSEICKNCNHIIGNLEQAFVFNGNIVCSGCYNALSAAEDKQVRPAIKKSLQIACLWIGIGAIVLLCLFPPWEIYITNPYRRGAEVMGHEYHWCNWDSRKLCEEHNVSEVMGYVGLATIDNWLLVVECTIVAIVTGGLFVTIGSLHKNKQNHKS